MIGYAPLLFVLLAADPVATSWILGPQGPSKVLPDVRSVSLDADYVTIRSAGITLHYLGRLQAPPVPDETVREYRYRIPRHPQPATGRHASLPAIAGAFLNGMPVYRQFEGASYQNANLWHYDPILRNGNLAGMLERIERPTLVGFALDGYPIYAGAGMRSSYRPRDISQRRAWADGTKLTPAQYGPSVSPQNPLGVFSEDYEFVPGSGDLDQFNGRAAADGSYAYYVTSAFPYLLAYRYYGKIEQPTPPNLTFRFTEHRLLETVHEKSVHLIVVSRDLTWFDHVHPELSTDDTYQLDYKFPAPGHYRVYADFTPPGSPNRIESNDYDVAGAPVGPHAETHPPEISFTPPPVIHAVEDTVLNFSLHVPGDALQPYLAAWAHIVVIDQENRTFIHVHPLEGGVNTLDHSHNTPPGPAPTTITAITSFPHPGAYKIWAQIQVSGKVVTAPFNLTALEAAPKPTTQLKIPSGAIPLRVSNHGFEPSRLSIPANHPALLAITRDSQPNCATKITFPQFGLTRDLPLGETVLLQLPALAATELTFACGMGMYRGLLVVTAQ